MQGPLRAKLNENLSVVYDTSHYCPAYTSPSDPDFLDWRSSDVVQTIDKLINEKLGYSGINKAVVLATEGTSAINIEADSGVNVTIGGLNSFYEFLFLVPKPVIYAIGNQFSLGYCDHRYVLFYIDQPSLPFC